jgi:opacity protein-like surface antigen
MSKLIALAVISAAAAGLSVTASANPPEVQQGVGTQVRITVEDVYAQYPWMRSLRDYPRGTTPTY